MDDDRPAGDRRSAARSLWPAGLVGMLALMVVAELALARAGREIRQMMHADWRGQRIAAAGNAVREADILCFGDSLVKNGVVPAALEARLDRKVFNLAVLNSPTPASYSLFKRALDSGARPSAVVLDCNETLLWGTNFRCDVACWADMIGPADALQLARADGDLGFFGLHLVHWLLPSARLRQDVRQRVVSPADSSPTGRYTYWPWLLDRQSRRNAGALLFPSYYSKRREDPFADGRLDERDRGIWYRTGPFAKRTTLVYLDLFLGLAQQRKIPVFFVLPPIHPGVLAKREEFGVEAEYLWFSRTIHDRYPNVVVVNGRHAGFDYRDFIDSCHLHVDGATEFSNALAGVIADRLEGRSDGPRWVDLPRKTEPTARLAVEALDESMAVAEWQRVMR